MPEVPALVRGIPSQPVTLEPVFAASALAAPDQPSVGPPINSRTLSKAAKSWRDVMSVSVSRTVIAALTYTLVQALFEPGE